MRCLTLAHALSQRDVRCTFAVAESGAALLHRFAGGAFDIVLGSPAHALATGRYDALIVDDYAASVGQERLWRKHAPILVAIDDLADRRHAADLVVDPGYGRRASDYDGLTPPAAKRLVGPGFALVRPAFAALRGQTLARPIAPAPRRAFVSFGLSDVDGVAARATALIRAKFPDLSLDIALASDAQSLPALQARAAADAKLRLHVDTADVAALMAAADIGVGAGGASTWE